MTQEMVEVPTFVVRTVLFFLGWLIAARLHDAWRRWRLRRKAKPPIGRVTVFETSWLPTDKIVIQDSKGQPLGVFVNVSTKQNPVRRYMDHVASRIRPPAAEGRVPEPEKRDPES